MILKKLTTFIFILILVLGQTVSVWATEEPVAPTAPEAPKAPEAPTLSEITADPTPTPEDVTPTPGAIYHVLPVLDPPPESINEEQKSTVEPTGDPLIETGDATNTAEVINQANTNIAPATNGEGETQAANTSNGAGSENESNISQESTSQTTQENEATVGNNLNLESDTGDNNNSKNTGVDSTTETGDANTSGVLVNSINTNLEGVRVSEFNVTDNQTGDLVLDFAAGCIIGCSTPASASNTGNGSGSENDSQITQTINGVTFQSNDTTLENSLTLSADSGDNESSYNTNGDTLITTGDASVAADVFTLANNNISGNVELGIVNIYGDLVGDIILPEEILNNALVSAGNTGNGADSENTSNINQSATNETTQTNTADLENNLNLSATTGDNQTSKNTGGNNNIETGEASVDSNLLNIVNSNINGGTWWLVLVNVAGEWVGQILGAPEGAQFAGSSGSDFQVSDSGEITAVNSGNGAGSENTTNVNQTVNNQTTQDNNAEVINNLNLSANTGKNKANYNTGGDSTIQTGDAKVIANLINFVNNNISGGGKLVVTVVNVFGSWIGDFVTPGTKKEENEEAPQILSQTENPESNNNTNPPNNPNSSNTPNTPNIPNNPNSPSNNPVAAVTSYTGALVKSFTQSIEQEPGEQTAQVAGAKVSNQDTQELGEKKTISFNLAWMLLVFPIGGILLVLGQLMKKRAHQG